MLHLLFASSMHWDMRPLAMFFIAIGALQLIWGHYYHERQTNFLFWTGIVLHGGIAVMWYMTRIMAAPYVGEPLSFGLLDIVIGILEVLVVFFAAETFYEVEHTRWLALWTILICLLSGVALYYGGFVVEYVWPELM